MQKTKSFGFLIGSIVLLAIPKLLSGTTETVAGEHSMTGLKTRIETLFVEESVEFYSGHLGMTVLESWDDNGDKGVILGLGSTAKSEAFLELGYADSSKRYVITKHCTYRLLSS